MVEDGLLANVGQGAGGVVQNSWQVPTGLLARPKVSNGKQTLEENRQQVGSSLI